MNPTLSTRGHEQDVKAMLKLYDGLIERDEPQSDQETTQSDQKNSDTTRTATRDEPQNDQETTRSDQENSGTTQSEPQNDKESSGTTQITTRSNRITL